MLSSEDRRGDLERVTAQEDKPVFSLTKVSVDRSHGVASALKVPHFVYRQKVKKESGHSKGDTQAGIPSQQVWLVTYHACPISLDADL